MSFIREDLPEPIELTMEPVHNTYEEKEIKIKQGSRLHYLIIETYIALTADTNAKKMCLREQTSGTTFPAVNEGGMILWDQYRLIISTNGGTFQKFRFEYNLLGRRVKNRENKIYFGYFQNSGSDGKVKITLLYERPVKK